MRIKRCALAASLALAACGQGDSDNVMGPSANALSPAQVDLALGPEVANVTANEVETGNEASSAVPAATDERTEPAQTDDVAEQVPANEETEPGPTVEEPTDEAPVDGNSAEE